MNMDYKPMYNIWYNRYAWHESKLYYYSFTLAVLWLLFDWDKIQTARYALDICVCLREYIVRYCGDPSALAIQLSQYFVKPLI